MHYTTREKITVGVTYGDQERIRPVWFVWDGRRYQVTSINHVWRDKAGREVLVFFSVSDEISAVMFSIPKIPTGLAPNASLWSLK